MSLICYVWLMGKHVTELTFDELAAAGAEAARQAAEAAEAAGLPPAGRDVSCIEVRLKPEIAQAKRKVS